jgi:hypothetical protein
MERRGWDSNPRGGNPPTRFPSALLKPLGHLSGRSAKGIPTGSREMHGRGPDQGALLAVRERPITSPEASRATALR